MNAAPADAAERLLQIARQTLRDLHQGDESRRITLDSTLHRDLGLDSLGRVELFARIEKELRVQLPESLLQAETLRDIAAVLREAGPNAVLPPGAPLPPQSGDLLAPPAKLETLLDLLAWRAEQQPDFAQITICGEGGDERISYGQLASEAARIAGGLQQAAVKPGDTVALMLPTSREYFCAFFGVLHAGAIPVPLYPPLRAAQIEEHVRRHSGILANAGAQLLITTPPLRRAASLLRAGAPGLHTIVTADELRTRQRAGFAVAASRNATALLQYTSGSTGQPKGVVLSHANILANIAALGEALQVRSGDVFVSWLPLYHDMGLIGAWLGTFYFGLPLVVMSPLTFLTRPLRWLEEIHRRRGALSAAPNFAYELCLKRISDEELAGLDLSSWRIAMNGAEPVMPETLARFQDRFARCGLNGAALTPVYGMAECSVGLTVPPLERGPRIDSVDRAALATHGVAAPAAADALNPLRFVSCGLPLPRHEVRIVDADGRELGERREGQLHFRGPSATAGYFRNPVATEQLLHDGWLDSGDRAYLAHGEVYVTGRIKDIIIRAGRHIYPEELEAAVGGVAGVRKGCVAVIGATDAASGTERVVVMAETALTDALQRKALREHIVRRVVEQLGEPPDEVVLVAPHVVLKTSSGKIRRAACRALFETGGYRNTRSRAAWLQIMRLLFASSRAWRRRASGDGLTLLYAAYFWLVFALVAAPVLLLTLPRWPTDRVWRLTHRAARCIIGAARLPFTIDAPERLRTTASHIIVVNHASYLDGLFLLAAMHEPHRFVAKRELLKTPVIGRFLRRLGCIFVERFDARASAADAARLAALAARGAPCIYFPEGSFTRAPGLQAFHLGAFATAVETRTPVLPLALRGARTALREGSWTPHRAQVELRVGAPIDPPTDAEVFTAAVELRDAARTWIAQQCGEPDLLAGAPVATPSDPPRR